MKLEPVYLVAPKPKPPTVPTRRAFLIAGGTFLAGVGLGGACGYAVGVRSEPEEGDAADDALKPTGDATLDELRRLAVTAPIEELWGKRMIFLELLTTRYRQDHTLWRGVEKLCNEVVGNANLKQRRPFAGWLATVIAKGDESLTKDLRPRINELRRIK